MKKILLAYDGGEPARRAIELTADLARHYGASVSVVSVTPVHAGRAPIDPWDDRPVHLAELREAQQMLREQGSSPRSCHRPVIRPRRSNGSQPKAPLMP